MLAENLQYIYIGGSTQILIDLHSAQPARLTLKRNSHTTPQWQCWSTKTLHIVRPTKEIAAGLTSHGFVIPRRVWHVTVITADDRQKVGGIGRTCYSGDLSSSLKTIGNTKDPAGVLWF
jgi:hypothetical protein